jgi:hypothetical protein
VSDRTVSSLKLVEYSPNPGKQDRCSKTMERSSIRKGDASCVLGREAVINLRLLL